MDFVEKAERVGIDEYFMQIAKLVSKRSTCVRRDVGAVIVKDKHIISTGYNGAPRGLEHCLDIGCIRKKNNVPSGKMHELCRAIHAEQNAIIQASLNGASTEGATLYCTHSPCVICAKMIINAKIRKVYYSEGYPDEGARYLDEAGVEMVCLPIDGPGTEDGENL